MRGHHAGIGIAVLLVAGAGAVIAAVDYGGSAEEASVEIPAPQEGARYDYRGSNGTYLNVTVEGAVDRLAGDLTSRRGVLLHWTIENPPYTTGNVTRPFNETVDPGGSIVQFDSTCAIVYGDPDTEPRCYDERARVALGLEGLPGGFGAAPFWNGTVPAAPEVPVDNPLLGNRTIAYEAEPVEARGEKCAHLEGDGNLSAGRVGSTYWHVAHGPIVLCPGLALPASFSPIEAEVDDRLRLVDHEPGEGPPLDPAPKREQTGAEIQQRAWERPFLVDPQPAAAEPLPLREAHHVALNESDAYRALFEDDALVVDTDVTRASRTETLPGQPVSTGTFQYERELTAADASGHVVHVTVEKTVERYRVGPETIYRNDTTVQETREGDRERVPTPADAAPTQASMASVLDLGRKLATDSLAHEWHRMESVAGVQAWSAGGPWPRSAGYVAHGFFEDPQPGEDPSPAGVSAPYRFAVDGPTGFVLWFETRERTLPFTAEDVG